MAFAQVPSTGSPLSRRFWQFFVGQSRTNDEPTSEGYAHRGQLTEETTSGVFLSETQSLERSGQAAYSAPTDEVALDAIAELSSVGQATSSDEPDILMAQLAAAAEAGDEQMFVAVYQLIDWSQRTAEAFTRAIQWALAAGAHYAARTLAATAAQQHPKSTELQKYNRILSPPKTLQSNLPPDASIRTNHEWLRTNREQYSGRWVALHSGQLVAAANSLQELTEQLGTAPEILFTKVF